MANNNKKTETTVIDGANMNATTGAANLTPGSTSTAIPVQAFPAQAQAPLESESVTIPKETLERILHQLDKQDAALGKASEQIELLRTAANQGKLIQAENAAKPAELPKAFLKVFMGKIVVGWKTVKSETFFNPANPDFVIGEVLKSNYTFIDGSESGPIDQVLFTRCEDRVVISLLNSKEELKNPNLKELKIRFEYLVTSDEQLRESFVVPTEEAVVSPNFINP